MNDSNTSSQIARPRRPAWNKGKLTGPKPPLRSGHVWSVRGKLRLERRTRDLAMFNLAIEQQAARLRSRVDPRGRCGAQRIRGRQSNYPQEENRLVRPIRTYRGHTPGAGRQHT